MKTTPRSRSIVILLLFPLLTPSSWAKTVMGIDFPDSVTVGKETLLRNGIGLRQKTIFKVNVYLGALYLHQPTQDAEKILKDDLHPKVLTLAFLRDVTVKQLAEAIDEGFQDTCQARGKTLGQDLCEPHRKSLDALKSALHDVKKQEHSTFRFFSDRIEVQDAQGQVRSFEGGQFSNFLLSIFIGPKPPSEDLREGLLGKLILTE